MTRALAAGLVALAAAGTASPLAAAGSAAAVVDAAAAKLGFRGVVRVERDGRVLVEKGYGGRDPATAFWVASVSKSFTAILVLRLQEQGKLRLQDPISRFLPEGPPGVGEITVDELLTHTSGLPRATYEADGIADRDEAARRILALPRGERGKFAYTNDGYALLAIVAEKAGRAPFFDLLRREVLVPAGLAHTGSWPGCAKGVRVAKLAGPPTGARAKANWGFKGGEGICTTAGDLSRFFRALEEGKLLSRASLDLLWAEAVPTSAGSVGRGFFVSRGAAGERVVWTRGTEGEGHNAVAKWFPGERALVIALSDVPEPRPDVPAPSRAMGDLLEERLGELR